MGFEKVYITKQGALLAAKTLQGKKIEFDHAEIGSGTLTGSAAEKTSLTTKVLECEIAKVEITKDTQASVSFIFKNTDAKNAFYFREIGLFAIDPDTKSKVLYAYANAGNTAEYINNSIAEKIEKHIKINVVVDNASNVTIILDSSEIYVTEKELQEAIKEAQLYVGKNYGVRRKVTDNTKSQWERICDSVGLIANASKKEGELVQNDFDMLYPWSDIKTYNYDKATKRITAYIGDSNFRFDGSNGEVLTKIPEFWYKREVKDGYEYVYIADYARADYKHSETFSVGRYAISVDSEGIAHSHSSTVPAYNRTISEFRTLATAIGEGFCQMDTRYFILELLYLVEYADYNSQGKLGRGVTEFASYTALIAENNVNRIIVSASSNMYVGRTISIGKTAAWDNTVASERDITKIEEYNDGAHIGKAVYFSGTPVNIAVGNAIWVIGQKSGQCDVLEMKSGTLANDGAHSVIYRGIENIFGNMWQFIDGVSIKDYVAYICEDPTQYQSDKFVSPYKPIGYTNLSVSEVYTNKMGYDENNESIALPVEANGSSNSGTCDHYWSAAGNRIVLAGGRFGNGAYSGLFCWNCRDTSSHLYWSYGARLLKYQ